MIQPFTIFEKKMIVGLINLRKVYLVAQYYPAGMDHFSDTAKIPILLTDYDDASLAQVHLGALRHDRYGCIMDLNKDKHLAKLQQMLGEGSEYIVYWAVVSNLKDLKKNVDLNYTNNIRNYITKNTNWRIGADETVRPVLQVIFGELFIALKRGDQEIRVKFEEIEKS
jgi:hypothetical protein